MKAEGRTRVGVAALVTALVLLPAAPVAAQADMQVWGALTLDWIKSHAWTMGLDVEPKALVSKPDDKPSWATLDVTPSVEWTPGNWLTLDGELHTGRTRQSNDVDTTEVTPRIGVRLHVLANIADDWSNERHPKHRVAVSTLIRAEWRNLFYSDSTPRSSTFRLRDRVETQVSLNKPTVAEDGAIYATSDIEFFWTDRDPPERFASKERIRAGVGYRRSYAWRFEALYIWDRSRDAADEEFTTNHDAVDVRVRYVW